MFFWVIGVRRSVCEMHTRMTHGSFGMPFNLAYAYHSLDAREHASDQFTTGAVHSVNVLGSLMSVVV